MSVNYPAGSPDPILTLGLPVYAGATSLLLTNNTTGKALTLSLPPWDGDDLTLDFAKGRITDQDGQDRLDLVSGELWTPTPLVVGANDVHLQAVEQGSAVSSGPRSPGTIVDDAAVGTLAWSNPGNAAASDDVRATSPANVNQFQETHYLKATNFGFALPAGASILGITAEIERSEASTSSNGKIRDKKVRIVKGGTVQSTQDKAATGTDWPTTDGYRSYGGSGDLWGVSWTQADINSAGFGLALSITGTLTSGETARVDHMRMTVRYLPTATPAAYGGTAAWRWRTGYS